MQRPRFGKQDLQRFLFDTFVVGTHHWHLFAMRASLCRWDPVTIDSRFAVDSHSACQTVFRILEIFL